MKSREDLERFAIANFDLIWAQRYLVAYIELMTPPNQEETDRWLPLRSREFPGEHNFLDIISRSLATSSILAYSRPWSSNKGPGGKTARLPNMIFQGMASVRRREDSAQRLLPFDDDLHARVLTIRNRIVAHSDSSEWTFEMSHTLSTTETRLEDPFDYLTLDEARSLLINTQSLRSQIAEYRREAIASDRSTRL